MRLTVLVDNNTFIDQYYLGEPAVCFYIEDGDARILLDAGYSDILIKNAKAMNIDLRNLTHIALSHGHNDHTRGLGFLSDAVNMKNIEVVAHPGVFASRYDQDMEIGCPVEKSFLEKNCRLTLTRESRKLSEHITFLGEIPAYNDFERDKPMGMIKENGVLKGDFITDDSALVYKGKDGFFVITGCSHSGICNIVEHAKKVCGSNKISGIIGGFHLFEVSARLEKTIACFKPDFPKNVTMPSCLS